MRLRLTLGFAVVMAGVLGAACLFLFLNLRSELNASIEQSLETRAGDAASLVARSDAGLLRSGRSQITEQGQSFAQVLDRQGRVVDATPLLRARSLLSPAELVRAERGQLVVDRGKLPGLEGSARLLAIPLAAHGQRLVVVVGASLEDRNDALGKLAVLLAIGGPLALLLASGAGYGLAAAALRPVEAMRRRAAAISGSDLARRLPVPPARDEIARLGATLNAMLERIEEVLARERAFVADASHELRTPLAILKTELELALRGGRSPRELEAAIASAAEESDRLSQLADDLLVIARSDRGQLPVQAAEQDVERLGTRVLRRFSPRAEEAGRTLALDVPSGLAVMADRLRAEQALSNLLDNALRYGEGEVTMSARRAADSVALHVLDRGPGFPEGFLAEAFERFTRADHARSRGGAGLGLAIVRAIARAHGGEAGAANRPGGGGDIWLTLPAA